MDAKDFVPIQATFFGQSEIRINDYYLKINHPNRKFPKDFQVIIDNIYFTNEEGEFEFLNVQPNLKDDDYIDVYKQRNSYLVDMGITILLNIPKEHYEQFILVNQKHHEGVQYELSILTLNEDKPFLTNDGFEVIYQQHTFLEKMQRTDEENFISREEDIEEKAKHHDLEEGEIDEDDDEDYEDDDEYADLPPLEPVRQNVNEYDDMDDMDQVD